MDAEGPLHGRRCSVPADEGEVATHRDIVLSTVEQKEMKGEKTVLPLVGEGNHGAPNPLRSRHTAKWTARTT
jgi:hypothetical protein